ncbi:tetratricopeptide repeat protein [Flavobacterium anhuiense]|uniref:tetratricopeptide repeat protein n=1 Tax=Flavobacterium anhuiense TaxID=459526 RepID=UPI003D987562
MKNKYYLIFFFCFVYNLSLAQVPPPPPPSSKQNAKDLIYGDSYNNDKKNDKAATVGVKKSNQTYKETTPIKVKKFNIAITESTNVNSIYYYKTVEALLQKLDTTAVTAAQIISLTKYKIYSKAINPNYLDSLARKAYKLNEEKKYDEAVVLAKEILKQSPNNITGHKELAYAYKRLNNMKLSDLHFKMMVKIINSVFQYGEGSRQSPFILNNFFEGVSIYEAKFGVYPQRTRLILTKDKVLLGGYDSYHIMRFANFTHWFPQLKEGDYKVELN